METGSVPAGSSPAQEESRKGAFAIVSGKAIYTGPTPDRRCIGSVRHCRACHYKFKKTEAAIRDGAGNIIGPECPNCGRVRDRCEKWALAGLSMCLVHGGYIHRKKASSKTCLERLDAPDKADVLKMIEEDDTSLKNEFHILRFYFSKAMKQYENAVKAYENDKPVDIIGEGNRLVAMIDRLATIAEKRTKAIPLLQEQIVRVQFDDPSVKYHLKERLREMETFTIRRVLAVLLEAVDPKGELGFAQKIPDSFAPYLPPSKEVRVEVMANGEGGEGTAQE